MSLWTVLFGAAIPLFCQVQDAPVSSQKLPSQAEVRSEDWNTRRKAFARVLGVDAESYARGGLAYVAPVLLKTLKREPESAEARKTALIELLEIENSLVAEKARRRLASGVAELPKEDRLSEEYLNYYGDVIAAVSSLRDPRSLNALLGAITTGGMATRTLVALGKPAVDPVAKQLESPDPLVRSSAAATLGQMLERSAEVSHDAASRSKIKEALMRAASDENPFVRRNAVEGLVRVGDQESIALVEEIARSDPYQAAHKQGAYLVREAAAKALKSRRRE